MQISKDNIQALTAFAEAAGSYCRLVSRLRDGKPERFYTDLEKVLGDLLHAILSVQPEMPEHERSDRESLRLNDHQWQEIARFIGKATGPEVTALYEWFQAFTGNTEAESTRVEMFDDDLADIYRDLSYGLSLWEIADPDGQAEAAWEWRFGYESHWGNHLFRAMTTVHEILYTLNKN